MVIRRKTLRFLKTAKCRNFAVECNWISRFSLKVQKVRIFVEKTYMGFSIKPLSFLKSLKVAKLHYNATGTAKVLKTLKKLVFFEKLFEFFWRIVFLPKKSLQYRICTNMRLKFWKFSKRSNLDFLKEDKWVFRKRGKFSKFTKGNKFGVECNWISKISQNFRKSAFVWKKEIDSSIKNPEIFKDRQGQQIYCRVRLNY